MMALNRNHNITPPYGGVAGGEASHGSNREYEVGHGMNVSDIDNQIKSKIYM